MKMTYRKKHLLGLLFSILVLAFFAFFLKGIDFSEINNLSISWPTLFAATLTSLSFRFWGVFIWRTILKDLGSKKLPGFDVLSSIYSKAWMGRYIPGSVTWIAGKIYLAGIIGISKSRLAVASVLEAGVQVVAITAVSLFLVGFDSKTSSIATELKLLLIFCSIILLIFLYPKIFNKIINFSYRKIKKQEAYEELRANNKTVVRSFMLYSLGSFISGTAYFLMTKSVYDPTSFQLFFYLVGAYNLAGVIGMATPFVPSGIGVRDGAQLVLLSVVLPKDVALALTVFSRLWSAVVDVLFYLIAQAYHKLRKSRVDLDTSAQK